MSRLRKFVSLLAGCTCGEDCCSQDPVADDELRRAVRRNELAAERLRDAAMTEVFRNITDRM